LLFPEFAKQLVSKQNKQISLNKLSIQKLVEGFSYIYDVKQLVIKNKGFVIFSTLFFILSFIIENINGRFWLNDFKVYYLAAQALLEGKEVYGVPFGLNTGFYKYSPFILFGFFPLSVLPYFIASTIHFILISVSSILVILIIQKMMQQYIFKTGNKVQSLLLSVSFICILTHLVRELHMGNMNMILLLLLSVGFLFTLKSKYILGGICIGIVIVTKPYFLLLMLPFVFHKKIKVIVSAIGTIIFSFFGTFFVFGFSKAISLHQSWVAAMLEHNNYITSHETVLSLIKYYIYPSAPNSFQYIGLALVVIIYFLIFIYRNIIAKKSLQKSKNENVYFIIECYTLLAIIPNLLLTDTEHFLFSLPLIILLLNYLFIYKHLLPIVFFSILIFLYEGNSSDILGNRLADKFDEMGMLGISNLFIIMFSIYVIFKNNILPYNKDAISEKPSSF